jgi:hypothetical protein
MNKLIIGIILFLLSLFGGAYLLHEIGITNFGGFIISMIACMSIFISINLMCSGVSYIGDEK